jgi:hypothetical protein
MSVLEQDPGSDKMQIEVIDDCSIEDDPEEIVGRIGSNRVSFFRQEHHVGMSANWSTCIRRALGHWVHILHSDDMVLPGFYCTYRRFIESHPGVLMVYSRAITVDENEEWTGILGSRLASSDVIESAAPELIKANPICAPTVVVSRDIYPRVGGFTTALQHCPDWEMWMRVAAVGAVGYIREPRVLYRIHADTETNRNAASGRNIEEALQTIEIGLGRLPTDHRESLRRTAYRNAAGGANHFRARLHAAGNHRAALRQALWAAKLHPSVRNLLRLAASAWRVTRATLGRG